MAKKTKPQLTTLNQAKTKYIGKRGTPQREKFEAAVKRAVKKNKPKRPQHVCNIVLTRRKNEKARDFYKRVNDTIYKIEGKQRTKIDMLPIYFTDEEGRTNCSIVYKNMKSFDVFGVLRDKKRLTKTGRAKRRKNLYAIAG